MPPFVSGPPAAPPAASSPALVQTVVALLFIVFTLLTLAVFVPRLRRTRQRRAAARRAAARNATKEKSQNGPSVIPATADAAGLMSAFCELASPMGTGARKASPTGVSFSSEKGGLAADEDDDMDFWCQGSALTRRSTRSTIMGPIRPDRPLSAAAHAHALLQGMFAGSPSMPALGPSRAAPFPAISASTTAPTVLCGDADLSFQTWTVVALDSASGLAAQTPAAAAPRAIAKHTPQSTASRALASGGRARARTVLGNITPAHANVNANANSNSSPMAGCTFNDAPTKALAALPAPALYAPLLASSTWSSSLDTDRDTDSSGGATEGETLPYTYESAYAHTYMSTSTSAGGAGASVPLPLPRIVVSGSPLLGSWS